MDQFFGEFAMVTNDTPRSANVTAMTHVKLVTINKKKYQALNRKYNNVFEAIFAPHKRDTGAGEAVSQYFIFFEFSPYIEAVKIQKTEFLFHLFECIR